MTVVHDTLLEAIRHDRAAHGLPPRLRDLARDFGNTVLGLLFPHFAADPAGDPAAERAAALKLLASAVHDPAAVERFDARLAAIREAVLQDARAIHEGDPAARSLDEVILAYPGFLAIAAHRIAHELYGCNELFARLLSEVAHGATGIDIHPGARIGSAFAIDHGTGIVIGETAVIGDRVRLYQGVTLGAARVAKALQRTKRHPTIGDDVVIYANATILGGDTLIGRGSVIGGNVWLTHSVPPYSVVSPTARIDHRELDHPAGDDLLEFNI